MQYFFLEKANSLTTRWKIRQVAFDPKTRYLYYSSPLSRTEVLEAAANSIKDVEVKWRGKIKVTRLSYMADDYTVPPTSSDFNEKYLLTLYITGYERDLEYTARKVSRTSSRLSWLTGGSGRSSNVHTPTSDVGTGSLPEFPTPELHPEGLERPPEEFFETAEENLFRDVELGPEENEDGITLVSEGEESEEEEFTPVHTPTSCNHSRNSTFDDSVLSLPLSTADRGKQVTIAFRATNYDTFRMVSLRLRQALVRHGLYAPLHKGLPAYDPRNGIAFATIPLHLRHNFRRLNDVVFYSFQFGHTVYLRNQREVRGLQGYLCITHDSMLLLQDSSQCPRWLDLEDIIGIDYVINGNHSYVSVLSISPYPDFLFIPIFPTYPLCSTFDPEEAVEGIVHMLRRLLMQRLRAGEHVSLPIDPGVNVRQLAAASRDVATHDTLCHVRNLSDKYPDVFTYILNNGAGRPLEWKWDNSKTPTRFTYKQELAVALKKEGEDEDDDDTMSDDSEVEVEGYHKESNMPGVPRFLSNGSIGSFVGTTVSQLLANPSQKAELRALDRLRVTRADPQQRHRVPSTEDRLGLPPRPKPTSIGLVPSNRGKNVPLPAGNVQVYTAQKGLKLPAKEEDTEVSSNTTTEEEDEEDDEFDSEDVDDLFEAGDAARGREVQVSDDSDDDADEGTMYFSYVEKQGNVFFSEWHTRQAAFDTTRRYLYYTGSNIPSKNIVPPNDFKITARETAPENEDSGPNNNSISSQPSSPRPTNRRQQGGGMRHSSSANVLSHDSVAELAEDNHHLMATNWNKKIKIDAMSVLAKERLFDIDNHLKEKDLYEVELYGETRPMVSGETPPLGPLVCPSTSLKGDPDRFSMDNEDYVRDPFFLRELYENLRAQFLEMRQERARAGQAPVPTGDDDHKSQTIDSPRSKSGAPKGTRVKVLLRMRSEYEFRRFCYVVQTVLGYDKLMGRPYRGLPPYDPRNGIVFAQIPMAVWHTFKELDKAVIYSFVRGDVVGRNESGNLTLFLRGAYMCITHDMVLIMRDQGNIPRFIPLKNVKEFCYNPSCYRPFVAFVSDPGTPDIIFIPQPPVFGENCIRVFNRALEVLRIRYVFQEMCFGSMDIRRVSAITETTEPSVRAFVEAYEARTMPLIFEPRPGYFEDLSCPMPKEQLAEVWQEVQQMYAGRDVAVLRQSAIPLYRNYMNEQPLTAEQMQTVSRRLARERSSNFDVVGMTFNEVERVTTNPQGGESAPQPHPASPTRPSPMSPGGPFSPNFNTSFVQNNSLAASMPYGVPGACYITQDDLASSHAAALPDYFVDHHHVVQTPVTSTEVGPLAPNSKFGASEFNIHDMLNHSFAMYSHSHQMRHSVSKGNPLYNEVEHGSHGETSQPQQQGQRKGSNAPETSQSREVHEVDTLET